MATEMHHIFYVTQAGVRTWLIMILDLDRSRSAMIYPLDDWVMVTQFTGY